MNPEAIEKLIDKGRDNYESRLAAGQARLQHGDPEKAVEHLEAALRHDPDQTAAWQELGRACEAGGEAKAAKNAWEKGISIARANGDKQAEKVMTVWLRRLANL